MAHIKEKVGIGKRKQDHIDLCATDDVAFKNSTNLLECVRLVHQSLPDLHLDDVDLSTHLLGKKLRAPIFISAMTGGTNQAAEINQALSTIANERGYGFGLGSQRVMQKEEAVSWTFEVRKWAPDVLLLGNIGVIQARDLSVEKIQKLVDDVKADALCIHLNPAMEIIQPEGDRDFRDGTQTLAKLSKSISVPIVAKETGNGISRETAIKIRSSGVRHVDTSGAGGTSWVGVETLRAEGNARQIGELLWDWGVPTAPSVVYAAEENLKVIATGGIKTGLDIARAIALGAKAGGIARPVLQAFLNGGKKAAEQFLERVEQELRSVMLLVGAQTIADLQKSPKIITGELKDWLN